MSCPTARIQVLGSASGWIRSLPVLFCLQLGHSLFQGPLDMNCLLQPRHTRNFWCRSLLLALRGLLCCSYIRSWFAALQQASEQYFRFSGGTSLLQPLRAHFMEALPLAGARLARLEYGISPLLRLALLNGACGRYFSRK